MGRQRLCGDGLRAPCRHRDCRRDGWIPPRMAGSRMARGIGGAPRLAFFFSVFIRGPTLPEPYRARNPGGSDAHPGWNGRRRRAGRIAGRDGVQRNPAEHGLIASPRGSGALAAICAGRNAIPARGLEIRPSPAASRPARIGESLKRCSSRSGRRPSGPSPRSCNPSESLAAVPTH